MTAYINSILVIAVISGIFNSIMSQNNPLKKYVNYICALIMVIIVISPIVNIVKSTLNIKEYINNFYHSIKTEEIIENSNTLIVNASKESVSNGIKNAIKEKFSFNDKDVYVYLDLDSEDVTSIKIKQVNVILTNQASWSDTDAVHEFLEELLGCPINVSRR